LQSATNAYNFATVSQASADASLNSATDAMQSAQEAASSAEAAARGVNFRGDFVSPETYMRGDTVRHSGAVWYCNNDDTTGVIPEPDIPEWSVFVQDGVLDGFGTANTDSVELTFAGNTLYADVNISAEEGNSLEVKSDGLFSSGGGGSGLGLGHIFETQDVVVHAGELLCEDAQLPISPFPGLLQAFKRWDGTDLSAGPKVPYISLAAHAAAFVNSKGLGVREFAWDGSDTGIFKTPNLPYGLGVLVKINSAAPVIGNGMTIGVKNTTQNLGLAPISSGAVAVFTGAYGQPIGVAGTGTVGTNNASIGLTADPTKSGIITDLSEAITSVAGGFVTKVIVATVNYSASDSQWASFIDGLNNKLNLNLSNLPNVVNPDYIVDYNNNAIVSGLITGTAGYEKWNSGKLVQWGTTVASATSGDRTVPLVTSFIDTNYNVVTEMECSIQNWGYNPSIILGSKVVNNFKVYWYSASNGSVGYVARGRWK